MVIKTFCWVCLDSRFYARCGFLETVLSKKKQFLSRFLVPALVNLRGFTTYSEERVNFLVIIFFATICCLLALNVYH